MFAALAVVAAFGVLALAWALLFRKEPWPFEALKPRGTHKSAAFPSGDEMGERKRDFARIVRPTTQPGLYIVTPTAAVPAPWTSSNAGPSGDVNKEAAEAVFEEFARWLGREVKDAAEGLADRVVAMVAVSEGFSFAMKHRVPPMFPQTKFVLVIGNKGEVKVVWLAYATDQPKPNLTCTPFIVKLVTCDLNSDKACSEAGAQGVNMDYVVVRTTEKQLEEYILKRQAAALSRAAVESNWGDVLGDV
mmetsp:Transcript_115011/g.228955  ORF Transcript_115011/g.228955 Transcript_115011/m.228955 type:complete len:247 (+) Transcript_115011:67-807(+)